MTIYNFYYRDDNGEGLLESVDINKSFIVTNETVKNALNSTKMPDGSKFDPGNMEHWKMLPSIYCGSRFWVNADGGVVVNKAKFVMKGGKGSGDFGHVGRPGLVGGSAGDGGSTSTSLTSWDVNTINGWEENMIRCAEIRECDAKNLKDMPNYEDFKVAINKMPDFEGDLYRGVAEVELSRIEILNKYDIGKTISFNAYTSTTKKLSTASYFSTSLFDTEEGSIVNVPKDKSVLMKLVNGKGKDLASVSSIPEQAEVVISKGSKFKIVQSIPKSVMFEGEKRSFLYVIAESIT